MANEKYPYLSINGEYFTKEFLDSVWDHLNKNVMIWQNGIDNPTPADKLAFYVMKQISLFRGIKELNND